MQDLEQIANVCFISVSARIYMFSNDFRYDKDKVIVVKNLHSCNSETHQLSIETSKKKTSNVNTEIPVSKIVKNNQIFFIIRNLGLVLILIFLWH